MPKKPRPIRFSLNVGQQVVSPALDQTLNFQQYVEQGTLTMHRVLSKSVFVDGSALIRVAGNLHLGATISAFNDNGPAEVTAKIPHPLFLNQLRTATGTVDNISRLETAIHIQAAWPMRISSGIDLTPFAGPTIFRTRQTLVPSVVVSLANEVYPYDTVKFPNVNTDDFTETILGYNAGVDLMWRLSTSRPKNVRARPHTLGLGAVIRYSQGSKNFIPALDQTANVKAGGLQVGGGIRYVF